MLPTLLNNPPRLSSDLGARHEKARKLIAKKSAQGGGVV